MIKSKVKSIMIQGTSSSAGKSTLTAGLLRYLSRKGFNCSPFKSQNMSLNSFVTEDGFEIAVSQAVQSEAAFKKPLRQINPILIKPSSDIEMHLVVEGRHFGNMNFKEYNRRKDFFLKKALESFEFLAERNDIIVAEGAGSPAEINLFRYDITNMGFAEIYDIPVILTADIEKGGVFASIYGTVKLLPPKWRRLVKGFIINKFRGDASILEPGIKEMERRLKIPCLGVVPHIKNLHIEAEDSLNLNKTNFSNGDNIGGGIIKNRLNIGIVRLDRISNFNEFDPLFFDDRLEVRFFDSIPSSIDEFDMIIIPGSKSTVSDLTSIKKSGIFDYIKRFEESDNGIIMGICGGFQMMGERITDPDGIESKTADACVSGSEGFGFFKSETILLKEKTLVNQKYRFKVKNRVYESFLDGYEIHNGRTSFADNGSGGDIFTGILEPTKTGSGGAGFSPAAGVLSNDNKKIGTYVHGLFGNATFKNFIIDLVSANIKDAGKEINFNCAEDKNIPYAAVKNDSFELLSENLEKHINIKLLREIIEI